MYDKKYLSDASAVTDSHFMFTPRYMLTRFSSGTKVRCAAILFTPFCRHPACRVGLLQHRPHRHPYCRTFEQRCLRELPLTDGGAVHGQNLDNRFLRSLGPKRATGDGTGQVDKKTAGEAFFSRVELSRAFRRSQWSGRGRRLSKCVWPGRRCTKMKLRCTEAFIEHGTSIN